MVEPVQQVTLNYTSIPCKLYAPICYSLYTTILEHQTGENWLYSHIMGIKKYRPQSHPTKTTHLDILSQLIVVFVVFMSTHANPYTVSRSI